ncbi:hypothetical protein ACDQ55_02780 [Chitinophaga sp. 30R24]|uniref:hypothetical protein n=1 Tax=Chitinophaga sp. 30R24 TaxID=3248838 RepID=UPI003B921DF5
MPKYLPKTTPTSPNLSLSPIANTQLKIPRGKTVNQQGYTDANSIKKRGHHQPYSTQ